MIVTDKNIGEKIGYEVNGNTISFNGELSLDLSKYERDFPVHIDISRNEFGMLVVGTSRAYVAEIDIPARQYNEVEADENTTERVAVEFDIDNVELTLWAII